MNKIFINSKIRKTCDPQKLLLNLTEKNFKRSDIYFALSDLSINYIHGKI